MERPGLQRLLADGPPSSAFTCSITGPAGSDLVSILCASARIAPSLSVLFSAARMSSCSTSSASAS